MKEQQNINIVGDDTISFFVPLKIKKRGGSAMIIMPKNLKKEDMTKSFDEKMIRAFARAYKWKRMLDDGKVSSLANIAIMENVTGAYVSRIFNLNFIAPEIVEIILNGEQPKDLKLQDMLYGAAPLVWQEQKEKWDFSREIKF
jgi:hypothetical protein